MALVASSNVHGFSFLPNTYEWPRLNELCTYHEAKPHRVKIFVRKTSFDKSSASEEIQSLEDATAITHNSAANVLFVGHSVNTHIAHFSNFSDVCRTIKTDTHTKSNCARSIFVESFLNSSNEHSEPESHERLAQTEECLVSRPEHLEDRKLSTNIDYSESNCVSEPDDKSIENVKSSNRTYINKKKRLKKIREKSRKKWKPINCSDLGFKFFKTTCFPNEVTEFINSKISEDNYSTDKISESEETESALMNETEACGSSDVENVVDDITFFHELGVDVLNFNSDDDGDNDILFWDGVYFPKTIHTFRPPQNAVLNCDKLKVKCKLKSSIATKCQTNKSPSVQYKPNRHSETDTDISISPLVTVYSKIKKCEKYKLFELECSSCKRIYIRQDRDRRKEKIHKAVKSKNCRSICNNRSRKRMYMHHRLIKMNNLNLDFRGSVKSYRIPAMPKTNVALDVAKNAFNADRKAAVNDIPAPVQNLNHALHETNCAEHLESGLATFLISLQHRDLTPEDYDMLLQLDDTVKPKTVSENVLEKLRTEQIGSNGPDHGSSDWEPLCTICMEPYVAGQERKFLPCEHDFHTPCIDRWLTNSSLNCPLDGLPIGGS